MSESFTPLNNLNEAFNTNFYINVNTEGEAKDVDVKIWANNKYNSLYNKGDENIGKNFVQNSMSLPA